MTRLIIPLITLGCFCILASYSFGRYEPGHHQHHAKVVYLWRTHKAAVMADVWGISPQELDRPLNIWGERNRK